MQLLLSVPFRSVLHLQPLFAASRPQALVEALADAASLLQTSLPQLQVQALVHHDDMRSGLYTSIDEDVLLPTVLPLMTLRWPVDALALGDAGPLAGCSGVALRGVNVHYYDQTVGILELSLKLQEPDAAQTAALAGALDHWSFTLARNWLGKIEPVTRQLEQVLAGIRVGGVPLCAPLGSEDAFFDLHGPKAPDTDHALLWVSRVLMLETGQPEPQWPCDWAQDPLLPQQRIAIGDGGAALRVGNSVVFGPLDEVAEAALSRALRLCNRFYAIAHVLSTNQRTTHGRLLGGAIEAASAGSITQAVRGRLNLLQHDYEDTVLAVQGLRRLAVDSYMQAWSFNKLLATCERRLTSVDVLVQAALQQRNLRYTRLVEAALTLIGGLTILDFAINVMNFARAPDLARDQWPGLTDLARLVPEDALLYLLLMAILWLVYGKFRQK